MRKTLFFWIIACSLLIGQASATTSLFNGTVYYPTWDNRSIPERQLNYSNGDWPFLVQDFPNSKTFTGSGITLTIPKDNTEFDINPFWFSTRNTYTKVQLLNNMVNVNATLAYLVLPYTTTLLHDWADNENLRIKNWTYRAGKNHISIYDNNETVNTLDPAFYDFRIVNGEIRLYFVKSEANKLVGNISFDTHTWYFNGSTSTPWNGVTGINITSWIDDPKTLRLDRLQIDQNRSNAGANGDSQYITYLNNTMNFSGFITMVGFETNSLQSGWKLIELSENSTHYIILNLTYLSQASNGWNYFTIRTFVNKSSHLGLYAASVPRYDAVSGTYCRSDLYQSVQNFSKVSSVICHSSRLLHFFVMGDNASSGSANFTADMGAGQQGIFWNWTGTGNMTANASADYGFTRETNGSNRSAVENHSIPAEFTGRNITILVNVTDPYWSGTNFTIWDTTASSTPDTNTTPSFSSIQNNSVTDTSGNVSAVVNQTNAIVQVHWSQIDPNLEAYLNNSNSTSGDYRSLNITALNNGSVTYYSFFGWNVSNTSKFMNTSIQNFMTNNNYTASLVSNQVELPVGYECSNITVWEGRNWSVTGNINISAGCNLHIRNSTIEMNVSYDSQYNITVTGNGSLYVNTSEITSKNKIWSETSDFTSQNSKIWICRNDSVRTLRPGLYINNSIFSYLGDKNPTANWNLQGGINIRQNGCDNNEYNPPMSQITDESYIKNSVFQYMQNGIFIAQHMNFSNVTFRYMGNPTQSIFVVEWMNPNQVLVTTFDNINYYNITSSIDAQLIYGDSLSNLSAHNLNAYNITFTGTPLHEWNFYSALNDSRFDGFTEEHLTKILFNGGHAGGGTTNVTIVNVSANNNDHGIALNTGVYVYNLSIQNWTSIRTKDKTVILFEVSAGAYADRMNFSDIYWENQYTLTSNNYIFWFSQIRNSTWKNFTIIGMNTTVGGMSWRNDGDGKTVWTQDNIFENISISGQSYVAFMYLESNITRNIYRDIYLNRTDGINDIHMGANVNNNTWINIFDQNNVSVGSTGIYDKYIYVDINVTDITGVPISGATVSFTNLNNSNYVSISRNGSNVSSFTTDASGHTLLPKGNNSGTPVLMVYTKNSTGIQNMSYQIIVDCNNCMGDGKIYTTNNSVILYPKSNFYRARGSENIFQNTTQIILSQNINYSISGYVVHSVIGNAINRTIVSNGSYSGTSITNGSYIIDNIPAGTYTLSAGRYGFSPNNSVSVTIVSSNLTLQNITLSPFRSTSAFQGVLTDGGCPWYSPIANGNCGYAIFIGNAANITQIDATINNESALYTDTNGNWILHNHLRNNATGNRFYINNSDVSWLKINDSLDGWGYIRGITTNEIMEINNTKITTWNTSLNNVGHYVDVGIANSRPSIIARSSNAKLNISNSNLSYLGWNSVHEYGVTYAGTTETTGCPSGSVITNSTFIENFYGLNLYDCANNITVSNSSFSTTDYGQGFVLGGAIGNTVSNNTMTSTYGSALNIGSEVNSYYPSYNNIFINNTLRSVNSVYNGGAVNVDRSYNNTITGGSIINTGTKNSYSFDRSNRSNRINNTGFQVARKIYFVDNISAFEYDNGTGVWIKTQPKIDPTAATITTRSLSNWSKTNVTLSETLTAARQMQYNVSGLNPSTSYDVYNDSVINYTFTSDSDGVMTPFVINFTTDVVKKVTILQSSDGTYEPPTPIYLVVNYSNDWINHSWEPGIGNHTDGYNVSVNLTWHNSSLNYYNNTGLTVGIWSNISVQAYNSTNGGKKNQTAVSMTTMIPYPESAPSSFEPPTPIDLGVSQGNFWIKSRWRMGYGNITEGFNVSQNLTWHNDSLEYNTSLVRKYDTVINGLSNPESSILYQNNSDPNWFTCKMWAPVGSYINYFENKTCARLDYNPGWTLIGTTNLPAGISRPMITNYSGSNYLIAINSSIDLNKFYMWKTTNYSDNLNFTIMNGGLPVFVNSSDHNSPYYRIWNPAIAFDSNGTIHLVIESAPDTPNQDGVGLTYAYTNLSELNFSNHTSTVHVIPDGAGGQTIQYVPQRNGLLVVYSKYGNASDTGNSIYNFTSANAFVSSDLMQPSSWTTNPSFNESNCNDYTEGICVHLTDANMLELNNSIVFQYFIEQSNFYQRHINVSFLEAFDRVYSKFASRNDSLPPHGWSNLTVQAYNKSGSGTLNLTALVNYTQVRNNIPVMGLIGNKNVNTGNLLTFDIAGTDLDSDSFTCSTNATKGTLLSCGDYSWTPSQADVGTYYWIFFLNDSYGGSDNETVVVTVMGTSVLSMYTKSWPALLINNSVNFSTLAVQYGAAWFISWNATTQKYESYRSGGIQRSSQMLNKGSGVLANFSTNKTIQITPNATYSWSLKPGLNLVGIERNTTFTDINTSANVGCTINNMWYTDPATRTEYIFTCGSSGNATQAIRAGEAVWMNSTATIEKARSW